MEKWNWRKFCIIFLRENEHLVVKVRLDWTRSNAKRREATKI